MKIDVHGIECHTGTGGVVVWSADWDGLYELACVGTLGCKLRAGGPDTYGHVDVVIDLARVSLVVPHRYDPEDGGRWIPGKPELELA